MSTYEINDEYESDIINLLECIKKYFNDKSIKEYTKKTKPHIKKMDDRLIADELLDKWLKKNKNFDYVKKKYKKIEFCSGGGGEISFKKIEEQKYYVILEESYSMSQNYYVTISYHIIINTKKNKVKLKKRKIISNTLPICKLSKILEKIIN